MSKRILIDEDQEDLRWVLRDLLGGSGYAVIEAADGQVGVATAASERPDLILMDIQLPVVDGYGAIRQIKADHALKATPIIAVSSFAMKGDEEKARAAGCDHYVTKPTARSSCCASSEAPSLGRRKLQNESGLRVRFRDGAIRGASSGVGQVWEYQGPARQVSRTSVSGPFAFFGMTTTPVRRGPAAEDPFRATTTWRRMPFGSASSIRSRLSIHGIG